MGDFVSDELEIFGLLADYAHAIDERDWEALAGCFRTDAQLSYANAGSFDGYAAFEQMARTALGRCAATQHLVGSIRVVVDQNGATGKSYAQAMHILPDGQPLATGVRYDDVFSREDAGWRIAKRCMSRIWGTGPNQLTELG